MKPTNFYSKVIFPFLQNFQPLKITHYTVHAHAAASVGFNTLFRYYVLLHVLYRHFLSKIHKNPNQLKISTNQ